MEKTGKSAGLRRRVVSLLQILLPLCTLATVLFIFANSAQMGEASSGRSASVTAFLNGGLEWLGLHYRFTEHLVRKLGHFCEYTLLGFWLILTLRIFTHRLLPFLAWPLFIGLLTAVGDELFQLTVPGRSGLVSDVAIDFSGILAGMLFGRLLVLMIFVISAAVGKRQ